MPIIYEKERFKELLCKNDECRKLLGYENILQGTVMFVCPRCNFRSIFKIKKGRGLAMIENFEHDSVEYNTSKNLKNEGGERNE